MAGYVQGKTTSAASGSTIAMAMGASITAGNVLVAKISTNATGTASISDTLTNTWVRIGSAYVDTNANIQHDLWYAIVTNAGSCTVNGTFGGGGSSGYGVVVEISGITTGSVLNTSNSQNVWAGTNAVAVTPSAACYIVAFGEDDSRTTTVTAAGSLTSRIADTNGYLRMADYTQTASGTFTGTYNFGASTWQINYVLAFNIPQPSPILPRNNIRPAFFKPGNAR